MSREDLRAMFAEMAEDVTRPQLVAPALARAVQVRRRRRAVLGAALALALVSAAGVAAFRPDTGSAPVGTSSTTAQPSYSGTTRVDRLPPTIETRNEEPFLPLSIEPPANAPTLAEAPLSHAFLLYAPPDSTSVYAYGEGSINGGSGDGTFRWVRLDIELDDTIDAGGNRAIPLGPNSLGPMGRRAAFAQLHSVVVVDFHENTVERLSLPGLNQEVTWLLDGRHLLIAGPLETWLLDVEADHLEAADANGLDATPLVGGIGNEGVSTLTMAGADQPPLLTRYDSAGLLELSRRPLAVDGIASLAGRGWQYGGFIAQVASGLLGSSPTSFVAVIDVEDATVSNILDLGIRPNKDCCTVLGWRAGDEVLVYTDRDGLLAWNPSTRAAVRLAMPFLGTVSLAVMGCPTSITIRGITTGCVA